MTRNFIKADALISLCNTRLVLSYSVRAGWFVGAGESIHTVALAWLVMAVSSENTGCVSRRHRRRIFDQAVSSVAPQICQSHSFIANVHFSKNYYPSFERFFAIPV